MFIYLDNSATTMPFECAVEAFSQASKSSYGNPSSLHSFGFNSQKLVENAKKTIATTLSCREDEIIFTSCATESNCLSIQGIENAYKRNGKKIITTAIEHPSVIESFKELEKNGYEVIYLPPNNEKNYTADMFSDLVDENTLMVSAMWVNNETGQTLPIEEISKKVKAKNPKCIMHVDGVQGFLKIPLKLSKTEIDLFSISGHKVHAPKGIGVLYLKKGVRLSPIFNGGGQQGGIRSGTEPVEMIRALASAVEAQKDEIEKNAEYYTELKNYLISSLLQNSRVTVNEIPNQAPHILSIAVEGVRSEIMLHFLETYDICVSSGSACKKGKGSHVLEALGIPKKIADTTLRISFSKAITKEALDIFVEKLFLGIETIARTR